MSTHHWRSTSGSIRSPERSQWPTECRNGSRFSIRPRSSSCADDPLLRLLLRQARELAGAFSTSARRARSPSAPGSSWSRPISQSIGSWPGVIFTAPVPNAGSTRSSAMIGTRALGDRDDRLLPDEVAVALVVGVHRDGHVGEHRRRPHGRDRHVAVAVGERVADPGQRVVDARRVLTSRSETVLGQPGHQFTIRVPR